MTWNWYTWPSLAAFDAWHELAMADQGIPHPGRNAATGEVDPDAQWTTAYTEPTVVSDTDVRARVEWFIAEKLVDGMGVPCEAPPAPELPMGDI